MVMREMHAYALGLADETGDMLRKISKKGESDRASGRAGVSDAGADLYPPSCNTGVNYLKTQENHIRGPSDRSENIYRLVPVQDASKPFRGL